MLSAMISMPYLAILGGYIIACADAGYGFLESATELPGVISVAMFNRNHRVRDSPLDSPEQPEEYLHQTRGKLEAPCGIRNHPKSS